MIKPKEEIDRLLKRVEGKEPKRNAQVGATPDQMRLARITNGSGMTFTVDGDLVLFTPPSKASSM